MKTLPELDPRGRLLAMINASWMTQALGTAARLRLPELLQDGPVSIGLLADRCKCDQGALRRLLIALVTLEVVVLQNEEEVALGPLGAQLRSDDGLGAWAELCATSSWQQWQLLEECVRTGRTARQLKGGSIGLAHLDSQPEEAALFNRAMRGLSKPVVRRLASVLPMAGVHTAMDVGGGSGELMVAMLHANQKLHGVVFDRPHAGPAAERRIAEEGLQARCRFAAGDFFLEVPQGAELLLLKSVLHDWPDAEALIILRHCREAMQLGGRLVVVERLVPQPLGVEAIDRLIVRSDLNMLVGPGGQERTLAQFSSLLLSAGFVPGAVIELVAGYSALEALVRLA